MSTPAKVDRAYLFLETNRIVNSNSGHFILLSLLFLPLTFSAFALLYLYFHLNTITITITTIAFTISAAVPAVAAVVMVTYTAHQSIHHHPISFSTTIKSLSHSFTPLLSTTIAGSLILAVVPLSFLLFTAAISEIIKHIGFKYVSFLFHIFMNNISLAATGFALVLYLVKWGLAAPIVVLEGKSGFEPLRQSENILRSDLLSHSFAIVYLSLYVIGTQLMANLYVVQNIKEINVVGILQVVAFCLCSSLMITQHVVANVTLYVLCKATGGKEVVEERVEGEVDVSGEYMSVAVEDEGEEIAEQLQEKKPQVAYGGFTYLMIFSMIISFVVTIVKIVH